MSNEPILIIDDNALNLKLEKRVLEMEHYQVLTARNAEEALKLLERFQPLLILMDFGLPGVDGVELTRQLRKNPKYKDTVIVIVSSYDQRGDEEKARAAGCDGYLQKPIDIQTFPGVIAEYLRKGRGDGNGAEQTPKHKI